ncbi:hypothetical protein K469DRAFT_715353 [Zopfia rhizophila CBS 207.26]|uniref:Uncharacterized protein n=1 Tax=Zopfia rhizophila CBS 207.26 TaxID=1314779 RepID=A0A6A6ER64_9PEZI|nr:hypothetical protein K469DRAFT_715353 [Zopfia rhizophila CBS 207.26]
MLTKLVFRVTIDSTMARSINKRKVSNAGDLQLLYIFLWYFCIAVYILQSLVYS